MIALSSQCRQDLKSGVSHLCLQYIAAENGVWTSTDSILKYTRKHDKRFRDTKAMAINIVSHVGLRQLRTKLKMQREMSYMATHC